MSNGDAEEREKLKNDEGAVAVRYGELGWVKNPKPNRIRSEKVVPNPDRH